MIRNALSVDYATPTAPRSAGSDLFPATATVSSTTRPLPISHRAQRRRQDIFPTNSFYLHCTKFPVKLSGAPKFVEIMSHACRRMDAF